ncbi:MAG: aminotransferase class IV [Pseudomonadota bacterium]
MADAFEIAWFNGRLQPLRDITISPLDRGYLFGDGVYEVIPVYAGFATGLTLHLQRLRRSLAAIALPCSLDDTDLVQRFDEVIDANGGGTMSLYLQISRAGDSGRDHRYPEAGGCNVFLMACTLTPPEKAHYARGVRLAQHPDVRWHRCDIKSTSLLANVMARQFADEAGATEALLVRDGHVTEASASAIACVIDGDIVAPPLDQYLLPSVTRELVFTSAQQLGYRIVEQPLMLDAALSADEMLLMSSNREVAPVIAVDDVSIGSGTPGPVWSALFDAYQQLKVPATS